MVSGIETDRTVGIKPANSPHSPEQVIGPTRENEVSEGCLFFDKIARSELKEIITLQEPWSYWTVELYGEGIKGQGGLGILASDTLEIAAKLKIPMACITPFYTKERSHRVNNNFEQEVIVKDVVPEERGLKDTGIDVFVSTKFHSEVRLDVYTKEKGSVNIITVTEPSMGELYEGDPCGDRRLYQNIVLGFGGYKAIKALGLRPSMNQQLNEAPTVFSALARLDDHISEVKDFRQALSDVRRKTIYTNHSNVPAAEPAFTFSQFEHFVIPNIKSEELKSWLRSKINGKGGWIYLSALAIELSGKKNGVSMVHAREASKAYRDCDGCKVQFEGVTNGISIDRWGNKELVRLYREAGVLDEFDLPTENCEANLDVVSEAELIIKKYDAKERLRKYLLQRKDQYGQPVDIGEGRKIFNWRRRLADYKRPGMLFENPEILADILEGQNAELIMAGNVHPRDVLMKKELKRILDIINRNETLRKRVHFIQDYDEDLGKALSQGADVSINTPEVKDMNHNLISTEACGTSVSKDMVNLVIIVSTNDGGMADPSLKAEKEGRTDFQQVFLEIIGNNYREEAASLYDNLLEASRICDGRGKISWGKFVKNQLLEYLPIISGARMEKDYINLGFPVVQATAT